MAVNADSRNTDTDGEGAFELRAASFTLPVIRLMDSDVEAVAAKLGEKVERAPHFFRNTPVVVDLSALPDAGGAADLPLLVGLLRGYGMIPFGVRGGGKEQHATAEALEMAVLRDSYVKRDKSKDAEAQLDPEAAPAESTAAGKAATSPRPSLGSLLVTRPVRSGQRVYAAGGDLSVTAAVSSGAELMADGNIHIYAPLRGRALAGMGGNLEARIFCQDLQAELISIAGHYRISENIPSEMRGVPVQIFLDQKVLRIEKL